MGFKSPLLRKENENDWQYHRRLVYGKLIDKTLCDYDYDELSKYVYGKPYSRDVARRMMYGTCKTILLQEREAASAPELSEIKNEIDDKIVELKKEQQKFYDQRREYNKLISTEAREENLFKALEKSASELNESVGDIFDDERFNSFIEYAPNDSEAVIVFSDWHYGMKTDNVFNKYNTDICKRRVADVTNKAIQKLTLHKCSKLHVVVLGDLIHGAIHVGSRVASEELVCDQIMQVSEILAQAVIKLSKYVDSTYIYTTYGNHARTVQNKSDSIHRDNMERLIPWWLELRFKEHDDIIMSDPSDTEFLFVSPCGHDISASHGDLDSVKQSPRLLATLFQKKYNKDIEYIILGDKHHRECFDELGITATICGSLCGTDDYANDKRLFSSPEQLMLIVTPDDGVDASYRLKCK